MTAAASRVDPRVAHTRRVVLDAAVELLTERGFDRITIDGIADRCGVARSTVYRNWPDRHQLLAEAFDAMCDMGEVPDTGSVRGDLTALGRELARGLVDEPWGKAIASLVGAASYDDELRQGQAEFSRQRRDEVGRIFERAIARGEVSPSEDVDELTTLFAAPFFYRRLLSHQPLDEAFVDRHVAATLRRIST